MAQRWQHGEWWWMVGNSEAKNTKWQRALNEVNEARELARVDDENWFTFVKHTQTVYKNAHVPEKPVTGFWIELVIIVLWGQLQNLMILVRCDGIELRGKACESGWACGKISHSEGFPLEWWSFPQRSDLVRNDWSWHISQVTKTPVY